MNLFVMEKYIFYIFKTKYYNIILNFKLINVKYKLLKGWALFNLNSFLNA